MLHLIRHFNEKRALNIHYLETHALEIYLREKVWRKFKIESLIELFFHAFKVLARKVFPIAIPIALFLYINITFVSIFSIPKI